MQPDQVQSFHERLNHWVANQGFWFQIRHSLVGESFAERILFQLFRITVRLALIALIAGVGGWVYLLKRADSQRFSADLKNRLETSLHASALVMSHKREDGSLEIIRLGAEGKSDSFFNTLEIRNLRCQMGLTDGLFGVWEPGTIGISNLDIDLRAGADDDVAASRMAEIVFQKTPELNLGAFRAKKANISWGFSSYNKGSIKATTLTGQRTRTGWRLAMHGGTFSQNWLRNLMIDEWIVVVEPGQIIFEEASFHQDGTGTLDLDGLRIETGARPSIRGKARLRNIRLAGLLPNTVSERIEGSISADLDVYGSTNASEGIILEGPVEIKDPDFISLRDQLPVLKALSVVDYSRNFRRLRMTDGTFNLKTKGGTAELTDIRLRSEENITLAGKITIRPPNRKEIQKAISKGIFGISALSDLQEASSFANGLQSNFALPTGGALNKRVGSKESDNLYQRIRIKAEEREKEHEAAERAARMYRYKGSFNLTLPGDTFEESENLQDRYPVEPEAGTIPFPIEFDDYLERVTQRQADLIYREGRR